MDNKPVVVITGASGYVGSSLSEAFQTKGWRVRALQRSASNLREASKHVPCEYIHFELGKEVPDSTFAGAKAFVHCAYDFKAFSWNEIQKINVDASIRLFQQARKMAI